MRVVFFTDIFYPSINGVVSGICNYANGLVQAGHSVLIFAPEHPDMRKKDWALHKKVKVCLLPSIDGRVYPDLRLTVPTSLVYRELKRFKPDVIHTHFPLALGISGLFLAKFFNIPVVTTCHGNFTVAESLRAIDMYESKIARQIQHRLGFVLKNYLEAHDAVLYPTEKTRMNLDELQLLGQNFIVHVPIPYEELRKGEKRKKKLREKFGMKKSLLFVGRVSKEKNIDLLIKLFKKCKESIPRLQLVIIGDGPDKVRLEKLVEKLGIQSSVFFLGAIPYKDVIDQGYFYLGDVFVTLSEFETQGMSTVEAMACKLPVVGARAQATTEVIEGAGILVQNSRKSESAKKLISILTNSEEFKEMQLKGLQRAQEFSIESCTRQLTDSYESVIEKRKKSGESSNMKMAFGLVIERIKRYPGFLKVWWQKESKNE